MASVSITVERTGPELDKVQLVTEEMLRDIGLLVREQIIRRTMRGVDVEGAPFQPLSEGYAKQKQAALGHAEADLQVSGNMLNHIGITDVQVTDEGGTVTLGWNQ